MNLCASRAYRLDIKLNQVEKDRYVRAQLDTIEVIESELSDKNTQLRVGDLVSLMREIPMEYTDHIREEAFTAVVGVDHAHKLPIVTLDVIEDNILIVEKILSMTLLEAVYEGYTAVILEREE